MVSPAPWLSPRARSCFGYFQYFESRLHRSSFPSTAAGFQNAVLLRRGGQVWLGTLGGVVGFSKYLKFAEAKSVLVEKSAPSQRQQLQNAFALGRGVLVCGRGVTLLCAAPGRPPSLSTGRLYSWHPGECFMPSHVARVYRGCCLPPGVEPPTAGTLAPFRSPTEQRLRVNSSMR